MSEKLVGGMGWERDLPDFRDCHAGSEAVGAILGKSRALKAAQKKLPTSIDLSKWCSPVENQGDIGSCTANAGVGLMEYYQRRAYGQHLDGSRLFLYKATRQLLGWKGDDGGGSLPRAEQQLERNQILVTVQNRLPAEKYFLHV